MKQVEIHQVNRTSPLFSILDELAFKSKNLYNAGLYRFLRSFNSKDVKTLTWMEIDKLFRKEHNPDFEALQSKVANSTLKMLGANLASFFALLKKKGRGEYGRPVNPESTEEYEFSGRRVKRGSYKTSSGKRINADVNAAYNIMAKQFPAELSDRTGRRYSPEVYKF